MLKSKSVRHKTIDNGIIILMTLKRHLVGLHQMLTVIFFEPDPRPQHQLFQFQLFTSNFTPYHISDFEQMTLIHCECELYVCERFSS